MIGPPVGDAGIEIDEPRVRPHEVCEPAENEASKQYSAKSHRQGESGYGLGAEAARNRATQPAVVRKLTSHRFRSGEAGRRSHR